MSNLLSAASRLAPCAFVLSLACASTGAPSELASAPVASVTSPALASEPQSARPSAPEPARRDTRPARIGPMHALEQMVTAQALLVSLLLTPLSKDGTDETVARVDAPASAKPAKVR